MIYFGFIEQTSFLILTKEQVKIPDFLKWRAKI